MDEQLVGRFGIVVAAVSAAGLLALAGALALLASGALIEGGLLAGVASFAFHRFWRATRRQRELARRGYFAGRRVGAHWVYEELHDGVVATLEFTLDYAGRGEYEIRVPGERPWREQMPAWARGRREEIVGRLGTVFKRSQMRVDVDAHRKTSDG